MKNSIIRNRRTFLKTAGAALAAVPVLLEQAEAQEQPAEVIYSHGMVWNTALPGVAGHLLITFDVRAVIGGTGLGTLADSVHPGVNSHIAFNSATRQGNVYTLEGTVIRSNDAGNVGMPVTVVAEVFGDATRAHIQVGDLTFMGHGIVDAADYTVKPRLRT